MRTEWLAVALAAVLLHDVTAQQQKPELPSVEISVEVVGSALADFQTKLDAYANLRRQLAQGLPPLVVTDRPEEIFRAERLLAERIREARESADRGDIFTRETRRVFQQLLKPLATEANCNAILEDNPGEFGYAVNADYPKNRPFSTVPPSMIAALPRLPEDIWYRFLDRDLILHDSRANVILDRIDDAVRCKD